MKIDIQNKENCIFKIKKLEITQFVKMTCREEISQIRRIKKNLLDLNCPHIDITEEDSQIKTLLLEPSTYRQELERWFLETLTDSVDDNGDTEGTLQSLGLDLKTLANWELALKLLHGKKIHSDSGLDGLRQGRHYLDFLMSSNLATPMVTATGNSKSNLIPRDIEKGHICTYILTFHPDTFLNTKFI